MELPVVLKRNALVRKSFALLKQLPRAFVYYSSSHSNYRDFPPILVNSFPKSGTHLLLQVVEKLPHHRNYDSFIASTPSLTFRERSIAQHIRLLKRIVPGEIVRAHLYYEKMYDEILSSMNCVHFFIYRDLRDVAISEAYYLTYMNKWHRMHSYYKELPDQNARISQAILGISNTNFRYNYPSIDLRFSRYAGWIKSGNVFSIKFEDLFGKNRRETIAKMMEFYARHVDREVDINNLVEKALTNVTPENSHTFRKGEVGQWEIVFTQEHEEQIDRVAGNLLAELGYSKRKTR